MPKIQRRIVRVLCFVLFCCSLSVVGTLHEAGFGFWWRFLAAAPYVIVIMYFLDKADELTDEEVEKLEAEHISSLITELEEYGYTVLPPTETIDDNMP